MLNKVVLIGRLVRDPDSRHTASGIPTTRFTLAVDRGFKDKEGNQQTDFIPVVTWRKLAEICSQYLAKGRLVAVSGSIQTGSYDDKEGRRVYTTDVLADEVKFLERGETRQEPQETYAPYDDPEDQILPF